MAVATQTQLALPTRSWDEEIVPALRKRLKEESATLSKRMSGQSLRSSEEGLHNMSVAATAITSFANNVHKIVNSKQNGNASVDSGYFDSVDSTAVASTSSSSARPSGIPRPSFSTSPAEVVRANNGGSTPTTPRPHKSRARARTISTPQPFENEGYATESTSTHAQHQRPGAGSSRSNSPLPGLTNGQVYRSRIPRPNTQQSHHTPQSPYQPEFILPPPPEKNIVWPTSYAAMTSNPDLMKEPRGPNSEIVTPRESMDEEGEYEHWYRGDVSRSGGVGEFKVAKRREMLDIANYGHLNPGPRSVISSRPGSVIDASFPSRGTRKRAGSLTERGSVYIEDESVTEWVIDELPLTDDESAIFPDPSDPYGGIGLARSSAKAPAFAGRKPIQISSSDSVPSSHPGPLPRSFTAPSLMPGKQTQLAPSQPQQTRSLVNGTKASQNQNQKRARTISKPTQNKKPKAQTLNAASRGQDSLKVGGNDDRPVSSLMMDAIPKWNEPIVKDGNWDNVVLPVVARKMGLDGQYEEVDGANPPRKSLPEIIRPAPGTFGFDYSKYRPPRHDLTVEMVPVGEFGTTGHSQPPPSPQPRRPSPSHSPSPHHPPPSPVPFAHYSQTTPTIDNTRDTPKIRLHSGRNETPPILLHPPTVNSMTDEKRRRIEEQDEAGCCRCVVM